MTYTLDESHTSRNYTPAANVLATFGYPRDIKWITVHHWGNNGQQFDVVRDYLCTNTTPTSAHFVVEDGQVACIVSPDDAAWHAGNAQGNAQSIGIECRPEHTDGDYQTVGELVAWLRSQYGDLPLVPHNYWTSTACPGDYDLTRIDAIARGQSVTTQSGAITPIQEDGMPTVADLLYAPIPKYDASGKQVGKTTIAEVMAWNEANFHGIPANVLNQQFKLPGGTTTNLAGILAQLDAKPVATVQAAPVDVDALATKLAAVLPPAVVSQLATQLAKL
jgi:hypothetical protein